MLNNFCFHVYAQKSLFIAENCNAFFYNLLILITISCVFRVQRAGSQLKNVWKSDKSWEPGEIIKIEKNWNFENFRNLKFLKIWMA